MELLVLFLIILLFPFFILLFLILAALTTINLGAFLSAGSERKEHPWKTWGLDEPKDESDKQP